MKIVEILIALSIAILMLAVIIKYTQPQKAVHKVDGFEMTTIDNCEYIVNHTYLGYSVYTHKGNCTNSFHKVK